VLSGLSFPCLTRDTQPSPPLWNCLTWKGKGEGAKSAECMLRGERFVGKFWGKSWGGGGIRGQERREMALGANGEERQSRAGGSGGTAVAAQSCRTRLGPLGRISGSQQSRAASAPLLALLIPSSSHRRATCSLFPASCPYPLPSLATTRR